MPLKKEGREEMEGLLCVTLSLFLICCIVYLVKNFLTALKCLIKIALNDAEQEDIRDIKEFVGD